MFLFVKVCLILIRRARPNTGIRVYVWVRRSHSKVLQFTTLAISCCADADDDVAALFAVDGRVDGEAVYQRQPTYDGANLSSSQIQPKFDRQDFTNICQIKMLANFFGWLARQ